MTESVFFLSTVQVLISTFLAFAFLSLLVRTGIWIFQIKKARVRSWLRMIPVFGVCLDALLGGVRLGHWLNPFHCASCLQKLFLFFFPATQSYLKENHLSLVEWTAPKLPLLLLKGVFFLIAMITCWMVIKSTARLFFANGSLKKLLRSAKICQRKLTRITLGPKITILSSQESFVPFAAKNHLIILPEALISKLSDEEWESVVAHEKEHLRWKDPLTRILCSLVASFFWWIPMKGWLKKMEEDQEEACDEGAIRCNLAPDALASAIVETTKEAKRASLSLCSLATHPSLRRLEAIFGEQRLDPCLTYCIIGTILGAVITLSCTM